MRQGTWHAPGLAAPPTCRIFDAGRTFYILETKARIMHYNTSHTLEMHMSKQRERSKKES